jgi:hypothetical protein
MLLKYNRSRNSCQHSKKKLRSFSKETLKSGGLTKETVLDLTSIAHPRSFLGLRRCCYW